jgi:hypothetical protein
MGGEPAPTLPPDVEVRRSRRRLRTVTAYRDGERVVVLIPARFTPAQEREWVARMVARLSAQDRRRRPGDRDLLARSRELSRRYLAGHPAPASVSWVGNQNTRWGSCTPADRTIRLSTRLQGMPAWVIDYVLLHELAHLVEQGHGPRFWALLESYPRTERARGFLEGFAAARDLRIGEDGDSEDGEPFAGEADGEPRDAAPGDAAPGDAARVAGGSVDRGQVDRGPLRTGSEGTRPARARRAGPAKAP